ncbi:MAG: MerR family transcriptional regulator [Bacillota bacterium]|nr:MerR family transcriptional regulator [Bacillota bacterium]
MKIGAFCELYDISRDTVRFYVKNGLLAPKVQGSRMDFSQKDQEDLDFIMKLKGMKFSLEEINNFMFLRRMATMTDPATLNQCLELLVRKKNEIIMLREQLDKSIAQINEEIREITIRKNSTSKGISGVPLRCVEMLYCPKCRKQLNIEDAHIASRYIIAGALTCECGYCAEIRNGIVRTGNVYTGAHDMPDLERKLYHDTGSEFNTAALRCTDYMREKIEKMDLRGKTVFEANINGFFFTYNFLSSLPHDVTYIIVDKYAETLEKYKSNIESQFQGLDILYIADAGEALPLAPQCIDLYLALFGENEYGFYHKQCQIQDIHECLKEDSKIIGAYIGLPPQSESRVRLRKKYPEGLERMLDPRDFAEEYRKNGFRLNMEKMGVAVKTLKHHMYTEHVNGEPLTLYAYYGDRFFRE